MKRREYSPSGIYHIMIRGNRKEKIFIDDEDRYMILNFITRAKKDIEFSLYAYCLMGNHDHLLIKELNPKDISRIMFNINTEYARFFNKKYGLVGHIQQDRFKSETIETEEYLLNCVRYIHNNPVKANMVENPQDYKWSSFNTYNGKRDYFKIVDKENLYNLIGGNNEYASFMSKDSYQVFLEPSDSYCKIKEESAKRLINDFIVEKNMNPYNLNKVENKFLRKQLIQRLRQESRISNNMIAQMLDISYDVVKKVK